VTSRATGSVSGLTGDFEYFVQAVDGVGNVGVRFDGNAITRMYTLTVEKVGQGLVTVSPTGGEYVAGTVVTLTATPATGWHFSGWSGACSGTGPCTITMDADKTVSATFAINTHTLTVQQVGQGTINQTPPGSIFDYGTAITLTATPAGGWRFSNWSGACSGSGDCHITMSADKTVTAVFSWIAVCHPITDTTLSLVTTGDLYTDTVVAFQAGILPLTATPPYSYTLDGGVELNTSSVTFTRTFATLGAHTVTFAARNCGQSTPVTATAQVTIVARPAQDEHWVYLPLVLRQPAQAATTFTPRPPAR